MSQESKAIIIDANLRDFLDTVVDSAFTLGYLYREKQKETSLTMEQAKQNIQDGAWEALLLAHNEHKN